MRYNGCFSSQSNHTGFYTYSFTLSAIKVISRPETRSTGLIYLASAVLKHSLLDHLQGGNVHYLASSSKLTSWLVFIFLEWICIILALASSVGAEISIFLSNRPERNRAGSRMSTRFVAAITWNKWGCLTALQY